MIDSDTGWYFVHTSVKAVVVDESNRVLLALNARGLWELPGGWPGRNDTSLVDVVIREVEEETGLNVAVDGLVGAALLREGSLPPVAIIAFRCASVTATSQLVVSEEHKDLRFFSVDELRGIRILPDYVRMIEAATTPGPP
ncbi:NUDIX hydrolase [Tsukamurella tyrosinosolvens]|uniref:NUDIX hydrolase n=1 Tax=Tsukamurella tyrosinosolvens TaxID=57704 RepID=UPI002DD43D73|nr:NUDIX hydrolase [Tsukamurella tyrosinosolvens]MEC4614016.1 NUDIX hydrolase [Tsukamurella tyrosinosolvens]